jgi:hypothetical protein
MLRWLAALLLAISTSSCAPATVGRGVREISVQEYMFGAFGGATIDVRDVCPSGNVREVSLQRSTGDYVASVVTLGLYLPHEVRIACGAPE